MYTYEVAPLLTLMEKEMIELIGTWMKWETCEGIGTPGGSFSNLMAMIAARHRKFPEIKNEGMYGCPKMRIFYSDSAHYSVEKNAIMGGFGKNSIV